nr:putative RNA-directed DNA polymerase, eukaryota, reverse transcriptase zinc-binding domain protein [Tanacetum cinerariifolium]
MLVVLSQRFGSVEVSVDLFKLFSRLTVLKVAFSFSSEESCRPYFMFESEIEYSESGRHLSNLNDTDVVCSSCTLLTDTPLVRTPFNPIIFVIMAPATQSLSNESLLERLSCNIFIINFPLSVSAKDLWSTCSQYGTVMDVFIPLNLTKLGKRFALLDSERSVMWICLLRTCAKNSNASKPSFASILKDPALGKCHEEPVMVLERGVLNFDGDSVLMGCFKEFQSLPNIHIACLNEGFQGLKFSYLGGFWILIEFDSSQSCMRFKSHEGINSWFSTLTKWDPNFETNDRVMWIDIEGIPLRAWSQPNFEKIARKWGELIHLDNSNVPNKSSMRVYVKTKIQHIIVESFKVVLEGKIIIIRAKEVTGWAPDFDFGDDNSSISDGASVKSSETNLNWMDENDAEVVQDSYQHHDVNACDGNRNTTPSNEPSSGPHEKVPSFSGDPFGLEDLISKHLKKHDVVLPEKVLSDPVFPPGFTPLNFVNNSTGSKASKSRHSSLNGSFQDHADSKETKLAHITDFTVKALWGNMSFDFASIPSRGSWLPSKSNLLFISVYSPQELPLKRALWTFFTDTIHQRSGEVVVIGDFNEVRYASKCFGFVFHAPNAAEFNAFIVNSHLHDIPLGDDFLSVVQDSWCNSDNNSQNYMIRLKNKLKNLKIRLKAWSSEKKYLHNKERIRLQESLHGIDLRLDQGMGLSDDGLNHARLVRELDNLNKKESIDLAQKAKVKWAIEGDENSKFYHDIANKKRRYLAINGILKEGEWIDNPGRVKSEFYQHFSNRFAQQDWDCVPLVDQFLRVLSPDLSHSLEEIVSSEEIKKAIWDCGSDKSSGPDGFTLDFFKKYWSIVGNDVILAVKEFFSTGFIPNGCNPFFIALFPSYVIDDLISQEQSAFIKGRQIMEGPIILNEVISWCKTKKEKALLFKVDFQKAFDSVRWDHLDDILDKFGFRQTWRHWIKSCLVLSKASILVNGSPTDEFSFHRGLRQGDPLSPFLFILVMESLQVSFQRLIDRCMFTSIMVGHNNQVSISHLFYADDVMFIGKWSLENVNALMIMLHCFFLASGLKINVQKSSLSGIGVLPSTVHNMATMFGCSASNLPFSYLGVKMGANMKRTSSWDAVINKVTTKLSSWKAKTLSAGGRLTLVKSMLGAIPTYYMSLFKVPMGVLNRLESLQNSFFLGADIGDKKITWVAWLRFWIDKWYGEIPFKDKFNRCFNLELQKDVSVAVKFQGSDFASSFRRRPRSGVEESQLSDLTSFVSSVALSNSRDRWFWSLFGSGIFTVKSARELIDKHILATSSPTRWSKGFAAITYGLLFYPLLLQQEMSQGLFGDDGFVTIYGSNLLNFRLMLLRCHRSFSCRYPWRATIVTARERVFGHCASKPLLPGFHENFIVNEAVMNRTLNRVCRGIKSLLGMTILPINHKGIILVISIMKGYVQNEPVNQTLWLAYTYLMSPILSLSLSMACDDSDGCVTMPWLAYSQNRLNS